MAGCDRSGDKSADAGEEVRMKIPPGTQGGQRFRLRGRGLPSSTETRGDLYVVTQIQTPKKI